MLPILYHAHHSKNMEDLPFWQGLWKEQGNPVLELGCGTGRLTIPLALDGAEMVGLDHDFAMLKNMKNRLSEFHPGKVSYFQADMTNFCLDKKFPLIILPCNTYSMLDAASRIKTLTCIRHCLLQHGNFAVSIPNPILLNRLPRFSEPEEEDTFEHPQTGNPVIVSSGWERTREAVTFHWVYDQLLPNGRVERNEIKAHHWLVRVKTYLAEIQAAGLEVESMFGDYDQSAFGNDAPYLILVARR